MAHTMTEPGAVGRWQSNELRFWKFMQFRRNALMRSNSNDLEWESCKYHQR